MSEAKIQGGYIILARKLLRSEIMEKPPLYLKLFVWMLLQASHTEHGKLKRGQLFTSLEKMRKAMAWKIGYRAVMPTLKEIRCAYESLTKGKMIGITKVTHGMVITILNYDFYQDWKNYEGHDEGTVDGRILTKKGNKERNNTPQTPQGGLSVSSPLERYPERELIERCFQAIASTRKSGRIAETVKLSILRKWERYPVEQVEAGIRTYLERDYAGEGKREEYLLGIIRNLNNQGSRDQDPERHALRSTGSALLDRAMRENWGRMEE